jgi:superfamily II DNA/RNA helicase
LYPYPCTGHQSNPHGREATVTKLEQRYLFIPAQVKDCYLYSLLTDFSEKGSMIIFVATCKYAEKAAGARDYAR